MIANRYNQFFGRLLFVIFLFSGFIVPQELTNPSEQNFHQWGAVTLFNGLPSDSVNSIEQTSDGIFWFGTETGLAKFDGHRVQSIANSELDKINALQAASDGSLWVGTNNGAFRYVDEAFQKIDGTDDLAITDFFFDDAVYISTASGTILKVDSAGSKAEKYLDQNLIGNDKKAIEINRIGRISGQLIAATRGRSVLRIADGKAFETSDKSRPFFVNAIANDSSGNVWLGADAGRNGSGLYAATDVNEIERIGEGLGTVLAVAGDKGGGVWVGTENNGIFHFIEGKEITHLTFENSSGGLRSNTINDIFIDNEGVIWLATNRGVCRFDQSSPFNQKLSENANANFVRKIYRANNGQIFAGTNRGLFTLNEGVWSELEKFSGSIIHSIAEDQNGQMLVATANGLFKPDKKEIAAGEIRAVSNFQGRTYAAIFGQGIIQIEGQVNILATIAPTALSNDADKMLWIGTAGDGVFLFNGKDVTQDAELESLRGTAMRKIIRTDQNNVWFAGERGLFLYKAGDKLQAVIENRDVRDFIIDGKDVWATTLENGLLHVRFDATFGWISTELSIEQGLPSAQIFAIAKDGNQLIIGTNRGIVNYSPGRIAPQIAVARVLSQRLHDALEIKNTIKLEYPQNSLLVDVTGLSSRTFPEQFQYAFELIDGDGKIIEQKLSTYSQFATENLAAGEYTIQASAINKDLLASPVVAIRFDVARAPFPWTSTALAILLALAIIGLIWAMVERRRIAESTRALTAARFDLANEAERERRRIARDLHDQTLADLRKLMLMSDKLPTETADFRSEIESVSTEIRRICEDLSPSVLENVGLAPSLEFLLQNTAQNYHFSTGAKPEYDTNLPPNVQMQIYRIAQEILNNIKRHSDAKTISMRLEEDETKGFTLTIIDDGSRFNPADIRESGRGIANIKARAALIEADAIWSFADNGDNQFKLRKETAHT